MKARATVAEIPVGDVKCHLLGNEICFPLPSLFSCEAEKKGSLEAAITREGLGLLALPEILSVEETPVRRH